MRAVYVSVVPEAQRFTVTISDYLGLQELGLLALRLQFLEPLLGSASFV